MARASSSPPPDASKTISSRRLVNLSGVKMLVLDEVDRMLDMGFKPAIKRIAATLPSGHARPCATPPLSARKIKGSRSRLPQKSSARRDRLRAQALGKRRLQTFEVPLRQKIRAARAPARRSTTAASSSSSAPSTEPSASLAASPAPATTATQIHGDRSQSQRNAALKSFSQGHHRVLVATDVAARGIDVADIAHVVNYDMPREARRTSSRMGRTGRASARGVASTFAAPDEKHLLRKMEKALAITTKHYRVRANQPAAQMA